MFQTIAAGFGVFQFTGWCAVLLCKKMFGVFQWTGRLGMFHWIGMFWVVHFTAYSFIVSIEWMILGVQQTGWFLFFSRLQNIFII